MQFVGVPHKLLRLDDPQILKLQRLLGAADSSGALGFLFRVMADVRGLECMGRIGWAQMEALEAEHGQKKMKALVTAEFIRRTPDGFQVVDWSRGWGLEESESAAL